MGLSLANCLSTRSPGYNLFQQTTPGSAPSDVTNKGLDAPQKHLHEHFLGEGHTGLIDDVDITLIDKAGLAIPTLRMRYWINRLRTQQPQGVNL